MKQSLSMTSLQVRQSRRCAVFGTHGESFLESSYSQGFGA